MSEHDFDPEVVALLASIAADPEAGLLRMPRERLQKWIGRPEETVSPHASHLTKAERHLVGAYREEAAWALTQMCIANLARKPLIFTRSRPDEAAVQRTAARLAKSELPPNASHALRAVAEHEEVPARQLAEAALLLVPNDCARSALAVALHMDGFGGSSIRLLELILKGSPSAHYRIQALENIGMVWTARERFRRAYDHYREAWRQDGGRISLLVSCLTSALQEGSANEVGDSMRELDRHASKGAVRPLSEALMASRLAADWCPTPVSVPLAESLRGSASPEQAEIFDAFL